MKSPVEAAASAYRVLRRLPPDWEPDYGSNEWNWFKIGWDEHWLAEARARHTGELPASDPTTLPEKAHTGRRWVRTRP